MSEATHLVDEALQVFEILRAVEQTVHDHHRLVCNHRSPETRSEQRAEPGADPAAAGSGSGCWRTIHCFNNNLNYYESMKEKEKNNEKKTN